MRYFSNRYLIICSIIFLVASNLAHILFPDTYWFHTDLHSSVEAIGAVLAILVALLVLWIRKYHPLRFYYVWIICGLTGMGTLDLFHSLVAPGESFVWLHSAATLTGGLLFAMVWLPEQRIPVRYLSLLPRTIFISSLLLGLLSIVLSDFIPAMLLKGGGFTQAALLINLSGGLFFIAAAAWFIKEYIRDKAFDALLFSFNSLLFGISGLLFYFSDLWDVGWWLRHAVRLAAYFVAIYYVFSVYKELTDQIQKQKDKAQRYLDVAASILAVINVNEKVVLINRKGCMLLGCKEEEITGRNWFDTFLPERSRNDSRLFFRKLIADASDQYAHSETPVLTKKGDERFIAWHNTLLKDEAGNIISVLLSGEDVTDRKKAEEDLWKAHQTLETRVKERTAELEKANVLLNKEIIQRTLIENALRKSEQRFEKAQAMGRIGSWEWDIQSNQVSWSDEVYRVYGYQPGEIEPDYEIVKKAMHPESIKVFLEAIDSALRGERPFDMEYTFFRKDGQTSVLHTKGEAVCDSAGRPVKMFGVVQDITERRLAEEKLKLAGAYNRSLIEASLDPLVTIAADGKITDVNMATELVTGYSREELIGTDFSEYFTEPEKARGGYQKVFRDGKVYDYALEISHRNGHTTPVLYNASVYSNEAGEVIGVFAAARNITERKKMEDRIRASLKEKEVLLQEIHHRVKNNMTVISSLLKLQADKVKDEHYKELFNESTNRIKTMALIHEKLYRSEDLARIVFSDYIKDMMDNILGSYGIDASKVHLKRELERIILPLDTSIPCGLIVNELLSNSLKYAFPGGRLGEIRVSLRNNKGKVELMVGDDGVGLPAYLDFRNTGSLGLNIVNALVRQIRGNIELHTERGTEFLITFGSNN